MSAKRTAPATQKVYTLLHNWTGDEFTPQFSFHAKDNKDADDKVIGWARYHSFDYSSVSCRIATEHEAKYWLHDEYVD